MVEATDIRARLAACPTVALGQWPTPVEPAKAGTHPIQVKRDDLSGFGRGGAKTRKLEPLLGYLQDRGRTELITVAGNITNLAFDLVAARKRLGAPHLHLLIQDDPPLPAAQRDTLFSGVRDQVTLVGRSRGLTLARALGRYVAQRATGRRPFLLLPGGSHPAAIIGNALGFLEMADQYLARGEPLPDRVYVSLATGTTLAGFLIGARALAAEGHEVEVIGVQVYPGRAVARTRFMLRWTERWLKLRRDPAPGIHCDRRQLRGGFGAWSDDLVELVRQVEANNGLRIDPIFGGKTWAAMVSDLDAGYTGRVLYWHCGHTPEWASFTQTTDT